MCVVALLALTATSASASKIRIFSGAFGATASVPPTPASEALAEPAGVAVDEASHDIYVADPVNHRIEKFDAEGSFLLMLGKAVNKTAVEAAAPEAQQNVCVAGSGDECQAGAAGATPGAFESTRSLFVAVDNSSGASAGDLYVGDPEAEVVQKFDPSGALVSSWGVGGQLDGSGITSPPAPEPGPFGAIGGVAVDTAGDLWVYGSFAEKGAGQGEKGRMFDFEQDATFISDWNSELAEGQKGITIDAEDNVYVEEVGATVKLDAKGRKLETIRTSQHGFTEGLTADPRSNFHDLYIAVRPLKSEGNVIERYGTPCEPPGGGLCTPLESFGAGLLGLSESFSGLAIDASSPSETVYAADRPSGQVFSFSLVTVPDVLTLKATSTTTTSATLNATVNPDGVALNEGLEGCRFEWGETTAYEHKTTPCDKSAAQIGAGKVPVEVHAAISGLTPGRTYHFRLVAGNANDVNSRVSQPSLGQDVAFGPPAIDSESASNVASSSATLEAQVSPQNVETTLQIEYGTDTSYGQSTPVLDIGSSGADQSVAQHIEGLLPSTVYHYRVLAHNILGTSEGVDHSFITQAPSPFELLDGRQWELVSPADKHGALIYPLGGDLLSLGAAIQAADNGGAMTYVADAPTEATPEGYANGVQVLSARGPSGWSSQDIATPHESGTKASVTQGEEYRYFSSDLSLAIVQPLGRFTPALSAEASEQTAYIRTDYAAGDPSTPCTVNCYRPLVSSAPGFANVPEGTAFGQPCPRENEGGAFFCGPLFVGVTEDLSHIVLLSEAGLGEGATGPGLYEWAGGQLHLVSVLPDGKAASSVGFPRDARQAVSSDGSRVVWLDENTERLYLRENVGQEQSALNGKGECTEPALACTVELDEAQAGAPDPSGNGRFQGASADGSKLLFSDESRLTGDATAAQEKPDLYEYDSERPAGTRLVDLSASAGEAASVQGVPAISEDGSRAYLVATGDLTGGEENGHGETARAGQPNLYVREGGASKLVAVLSGGDAPDWESHDPRGLTARISPDGRWLTFMSERSLTGYDNRDAVSGKPDEEVYLYDADAGKLSCASCNPSGARPQGIEYGSSQEHKHRLWGGDRIWHNSTWLAANIPGWTPFGLSSPLHQPRYLSDSGRLFFNSHDALVSKDSNGVEDVYEFEPGGVGSCSSGSSTYSTATAGCTALVSSGTAETEAGFLDASENGNDVFFLSPARLTGQDVDNALDVYDAHVCSSTSPCPPPPPPPPPACEGDACQSAVAAPEDPTPSSLTYQGPGNQPASLAAAVLAHPKTPAQLRAAKLVSALKACKRKRKPQRAACERQARKRYGPVTKAKPEKKQQRSKHGSQSKAHGR